MIISCEKCNKKFELSKELVPDEGRLLQCGSCSYKWHYIPKKIIKLVNEIDQVSPSKQKFKKPPKCRTYIINHLVCFIKSLKNNKISFKDSYKLER